MSDSPGVPRVGVACLVMRAGRVLLLRRQRSHGAGSWSPPGGHLDFGETPEACAIRETAEETGLVVPHVGFFAITNDVFAEDGKHYITIWMRAEVESGEPGVRDPAEVAEVGWFDPAAMPAPLFLSLSNLLAGRQLVPSPAPALKRLAIADLLALVGGRRGHFRLESGHHGGLWLDLDALFADARRIEPFVARLADALRPHGPDMICGPLLGGAFLAQLVARVLGVEFCHTERVTPAEGDGLFRARYRLPPAFRERVRGTRVAMVDDVMSAGSALRGTLAELEMYGAAPVAAGALLVLGDAGLAHFAARGIPVEAVVRDAYDLWVPADCPLCARGVPLEDASTRPD